MGRYESDREVFEDFDVHYVGFGEKLGYGVWGFIFGLPILLGIIAYFLNRSLTCGFFLGLLSSVITGLIPLRFLKYSVRRKFYTIGWVIGASFSLIIFNIVVLYLFERVSYPPPYTSIYSRRLMEKLTR